MGGQKQRLLIGMTTAESESQLVRGGYFRPINLVHIACFQLTWFASVMGAARDTALWGLGGIGLMLLFSAFRNSLRGDLLFACALLPLGWMLDSLWAYTGILDYGTVFAPLWILLLWASVGLSLNHSMSLFVKRPRLGALLAGGAAPFSYLGGERLGAVVIPEPFALGFITLSWVCVFYGVFWVADRAGESETAPQ